MKDALGHGSNPRGGAAHQAGVDNVGATPVDHDGNPIVDMDNRSPAVNSDGTLTLYHRTTPEAADAIRKTGRFTSKENTDETFFSTRLDGPNSENYGTAVVTARVHPRYARVNDAFHGGEVHVAISNKRLSKRNVVS